jgi:hypothetical protein
MDWTWPLTRKATRDAPMPFEAWVYWHYRVLLPVPVVS